MNTIQNGSLKVGKKQKVIIAGAIYERSPLPGMHRVSWVADGADPEKDLNVYYYADIAAAKRMVCSLSTAENSSGPSMEEVGHA